MSILCDYYLLQIGNWDSTGTDSLSG